EQKIFLDQLNPQVLATDDKEMIELFSRAVRNHDSINSETPAEPVVVHNKHYRDPDFKIPETKITLDVRDDHVVVTTKLSVERANDQSQLVLNGRDHEV